MSPGTPERPLRIAIIGAGPSGFYAADALLKHEDTHVDLFDRLPTPFGLARGGVAPDHPAIKKVTALYQRIATLPGFRYFGNVRLGADLHAEELAAYYDAWIYAVGAESDRLLGIPGEHLLGSHSATTFVGWYNGHPDHQLHPFDLACERVAVIGVGNVAMDVARVLAAPPDSFATSDIAAHALDVLRASKVREVFVIGRRGVAEAAFSPAEIEELAELPGVDLVVDPAEVAVDPQFAPTSANAMKNVAFCQARAAAGEGTAPRKIRLRFLVSPVEILGDADGRVTAVRLERNALVADADGRPVPHGTGAFEVLPVGMVLRSVGYQGVPIPGVPYDPRTHRIANEGGRVRDAHSGALRAREYVVGWAKRGPTGLIGTNRGDSAATVAALFADLPGWPDADLAPPDALPEALAARGVHVTSWGHWQRLDAAETARGEAAGKVREKFIRVADMLHASKEDPE